VQKVAEELNAIIQKNNINIYSLLSDIGKIAFFPLSGILAQSSEAKGKAINATIGIAINEDGSPMYLPPLSKSINLPPDKVFPYTPSYGTKELREKWKELIYQKNPSLKDKVISTPIVVSALTHGLSIIACMFCNEKENIILTDLFWENYNLVFQYPAGSILNTFNTFANDGFDMKAFESKVLDSATEKKILLLNFPNNPSGYTLTKKEAKEIIRLIKLSANRGNKILAILDDAYFGLVYGSNVYTESLFSELADISENVLAVKIDGPTKEDYAWGFRIGFITFGVKGGSKELYEALESKVAGIIRGNISNCSHLAQSLFLELYNSPDYDLEKNKKYKILKARYDKVIEVLANNKHYREFFVPLPFNSGYFMCVKLREGIDAQKLRIKLLEEFSTGIICNENLARIAFSAISLENIPVLFENLYLACGKVLTQ
jgi:aspartate/methionine/tyrosine aminotransferase